VEPQLREAHGLLDGRALLVTHRGGMADLLTRDAFREGVVHRALPLGGAHRGAHAREHLAELTEHVAQPARSVSTAETERAERVLIAARLVVVIVAWSEREAESACVHGTQSTARCAPQATMSATLTANTGTLISRECDIDPRQ